MLSEGRGAGERKTPAGLTGVSRSPLGPCLSSKAGTCDEGRRPGSPGVHFSARSELAEEDPGIQLRDSTGVSPASLLTPAPRQRAARWRDVVETSASIFGSRRIYQRVIEDVKATLVRPRCARYDTRVDFGLTGKTALVGGASRGIGRAVAIALAREGCNVAVCARTPDALEAMAEEIRQETGVQVLAKACDMAEAEQIENLVKETVAQFKRLDIVVNNAGGPPTGTFETLTDDYWEHALEQNLMSVVRTTREALPHLKRAGSGRIINITSVAVKQPIDNLMLSNAARLGVVGLAKTLSREVGAEGITVNNVCPGNIATERLISLIEQRASAMGTSLEQAVSVEEARIPMGFLGTPDDVANLVVFLASEQARYITGTTIQVDGGSTTAVF